jgi:hypothetical protein
MMKAKQISAIKSILLGASLLLAGYHAQGQTTNTNNSTNTNTNTAQLPTNAASILAPFQTAEQWLTSFSSNTWTGTHGYIQTGATYQNQLQFADALELGLNVLSTGTNSGLSLSDNLLTAGIAGTIVSDSLDVAWRFDVKDVQIQFGAGPGYDKPNDRLFADIMGELQKKMSANTHAYLRLDLPYEGKSSGLQVTIGLGGEF